MYDELSFADDHLLCIPANLIIPTYTNAPFTAAPVIPLLRLPLTSVCFHLLQGSSMVTQCKIQAHPVKKQVHNSDSHSILSGTQPFHTRLLRQIPVFLSLPYTSCSCHDLTCYQMIKLHVVDPQQFRNISADIFHSAKIFQYCCIADPFTAFSRSSLIIFNTKLA